MSKINIHNYEAYFLDFVEGNLSDGDIAELEAFLALHPGLRSELDAFDPIVLSDDPSSPPPNWDVLKIQPADALKADPSLREQLYFKAVENQLDEESTGLLKEILGHEAFAQEYAIWQKTRLEAGPEAIPDKDNMYNFGLNEPIGPHNYEAYLIARTEKLLTSEQNADLDVYAKSQPNGYRDLILSDKLKLKPSSGIFFPDKDKLKKKEKGAGILWFYRVAAVMVVALGVWMFLQNDFNTTPTIAEKTETNSKDTATTSEPGKIAPNDSLEGKEKSKLEMPKIEEWEVREPDPVEYAESHDQEPLREPTHELKMAIPIDEIQLAQIDKSQSPMVDSMPVSIPPVSPEEIDQSIQSGSDANDLAESKANQDYQTLVKIAEKKIAEKLALNDAEKDALAMSLAKRLTDKAGELLDAEVKRETEATDNGENMTFTLRVGSFKMSRTKSK